MIGLIFGLAVIFSGGAYLITHYSMKPSTDIESPQNRMKDLKKQIDNLPLEKNNVHPESDPSSSPP